MSEPWLSTHIERWPTEKLVPYARNARTHSEEQVAQIAASIVEFGFTNPILAGSDGVIVAGHGRLAAAQKSGAELLAKPARQRVMEFAVISEPGFKGGADTAAVAAGAGAGVDAVAAGVAASASSTTTLAPMS